MRKPDNSDDPNSAIVPGPAVKKRPQSGKKNTTPGKSNNVRHIINRQPAKDTAKPIKAAPNPKLSTDLNALANLRPGEWYEVQNSTMRALDPCPKKNCSYSATGGQKNVMAAWSGGAYDPVHDKFLVHGGGHNDYGGNEVYAFDVGALQWERLTNPSTNGVANATWFPDGTPNSAHSYDLLEYVPEINSFCVFGLGSKWNNGGSGKANACLDMSTYSWVKKANVPHGSIGGITAYDPVTQSVWRQGAGNGSFLHQYDSRQDAWVAYGNQFTDGWVQRRTTAAIDPKRRLFIAIGSGEVLVWDMTKHRSKRILQPTTGASSIVGISNPGLVYDPAIDKIVAWHGGKDVYTLDTNTWVWSKVAIASSNTVIPTRAEKNGTFGRFRYIPSKNLYIAVNRTTENVYFFKLSP